MRNYELTLILRPNVEDRDQIIARLENALEESKVVVNKKEEKGILDYAYEINHEFQGEYFYYEISANSSDFSKEFERICKITDNVVRYLIVKAD